MIPVVIDFETFYSGQYSLKKISGQQYIHDPQFKVHGVGLAAGKNTPLWVTGSKAKAWLEKIVPGNCIVCHNANFDAAILNWHYGLKPKLIIDTVSLSRALIGERLRSHSLDSISQFLLGEPKGSFLSDVMGVRDLSADQEAKLAQYCLKDVDLCRRIFYKLIPHLPKQEVAVMDMVSRMYTEPCLWLDGELLTQYHSEVVAKRLTALDDAGIVDPVEVRSNPRFAEALKALGVIPPMKTSPTTGLPAFAFAKTDEGMMELQDHPDERVQALVCARLENRSTLAETRAENFITANRYGEFPVGYLFSGAMTTHRLSGGGGNNLQNLPRGGSLRKAIMAPQDHVLVVGDLAQIELRITLALAMELLSSIYTSPEAQENLDTMAEHEALTLLASGRDLYSHFGSIIYQKQISKEATPLERQVAKSAVLGLGFGMGANKFTEYCKAQGIAVDEDFAHYVVKLYRGTYGGVVKLWKYMQDKVKGFLADGNTDMLFQVPCVFIGKTALFGDPCIHLSGGLEIKYPGLAYDVESKSFVYERALGKTKVFGGKLVENLVQYLARQIIMEQTVKVNKRFRVAMSTHDELVAVVPYDQRDEATAWVKHVMEEPVKWWPSLPLSAEVKYSERYGEAK